MYTQTLTWDTEGELAAVDGVGPADASYIYTADGDRLVRRQDGVTTLYLPGGQEVTRTTPPVWSTATRYYTFNGQTSMIHAAAAACGRAW